jgi:UDP-N-acetylmuramoyl-tripeptide--D-alanyl-D-alanine ligase
LCQLVLFVRGIFSKSVRRPVKTAKTVFLTIISFGITILFLVQISRFEDSLQPVLLLGFDILTPIIVSIIVLVFQPFFVFLRNITLKKAEKKLEQIKSVSGVKVIAITGSYGKTSTKEFLTTILFFSSDISLLYNRDLLNQATGSVTGACSSGVSDL